MKECLENLGYDHDCINHDNKFLSMILFSKWEGYDKFKEDLMGDDGDLNFNKYLPIDPNNTIEVLTKWGCLEAYETSLEEDNNVPAISFSTLLDIPYVLLYTWSKNNPTTLFCVVTTRLDGKLNDFVSFIYYDGCQLCKSYSPTLVTAEDLEKNYDDAYNKKYLCTSFIQEGVNPTLDDMATLEKALEEDNN